MTHGSEACDQDTTKPMPQKIHAATTVSYLCVGTVSQFLPELCNHSQ